MKFRVTFKTPNALDESAKEFGLEQAEQRATKLPPPVDHEDVELLADHWTKYAKKAVERWVEYGELVTIEFDIAAGTATVVPC